MKHWLVVVFLLSFFYIGCRYKNENEKLADTCYSRFKESITLDSLNPAAQIDAEFVAQYHDDALKKIEAKNWLAKYNTYISDITNEQKLLLQAADNHLDSLGGVKVILLDTKTKCNLTKAYYTLNQKITDTTELKFIAHLLAHKIQSSAKKDEVNCTYPLMTVVYLFMIKKDYDDFTANWVSMCSITPQNYSGDDLLNSFQIDKYKN